METDLPLDSDNFCMHKLQIKWLHVPSKTGISVDCMS